MAAPAWRPVAQMTDAELIAESAAITRAEDSAALESPVRLARHLDPTYVRRRHTNVIGSVMARVAAGEINRVMVLLPPQCGKTYTAVVWSSLWWLCLHPQHRVIIGSYGNQLAINRGRAVRRLVDAHGARYNIALEHGSKQAADWSLTSGGGIKSVGVGAGVAGHPGDLAVIDDPHKSRAEAESLARRDVVADWFSADITSRLAPFAPIVLVMTRWHMDDIAGRLLQQEGNHADGGRWVVIHMPAVADPTFGADPLGRAAGEPLPHPKIRSGDVAALRKHWEDKRAGSTVRDWAALYQGDPKPILGALLTAAQLREQRWFGTADDRVVTATPTITAVAVDPSGGGRDTCGIIGGWLGSDHRLYITHDETAVMSSEIWGGRVCQLAADIDADRIIVEANYGGDMASAVVRGAWERLQREELDRFGGDRRSESYRRGARFNRPPPRVVLVHSRKNKLLRAEPVAQYWTGDRIRTTGYMPELESEWATWQPGADSPGRIDASVHLAWGLVPPMPPTGSVGAADQMSRTDLTSGLQPGQM